MAKRILVPLCEDERAESILPVAAALARDAGGTVRLLSVQRPQRTRFDESARRLPVYGDDAQLAHGLRQHVLAYAHADEAQLESETLARLRRLEPLLDGVAVEHAVRFGDVVEEIAREADAFEADLIAVTERRRPRWRPAPATVVARVRARVRVPVLVLTGDAR
jgi:nucleotide-binding universal stress UspA family protein